MRCNQISTEDLIDVVVNVDNLEVQFDNKKIIHNVSFKVNTGEIIGFFKIS